MVKKRCWRLKETIVTGITFYENPFSSSHSENLPWSPLQTKFKWREGSLNYRSTTIFDIGSMRKWPKIKKEMECLLHLLPLIDFCNFFLSSNVMTLLLKQKSTSLDPDNDESHASNCSGISFPSSWIIYNTSYKWEKNNLFVVILGIFSNYWSIV